MQLTPEKVCASFRCTPVANSAPTAQTMPNSQSETLTSKNLRVPACFIPHNGEIPGARFYTPCLETCPLHPRTTRIEAVVWCGLVWPCAVCCGFAVVWCGHLWFCAVCCGFVGPWSGVVLCGLRWFCKVWCGLIWSDVVFSYLFGFCKMVVWCGLVR